MAPEISRRQAWTDIAAVALLATGYLLADLGGCPKRWQLTFVAFSLGAYGLWVWRRGAETWHDHGLRTDNFRTAVPPVAAFTALAAAAIVTWALATGGSLWNQELALLLPLYPLYGIAQQLVFQGILHRRLRMLLPSPHLALLIAATTFALVHLGDARLLSLTFLAGLAWSWLFSHWPNIWALGLSHGILAALAYPLLLGAQPLQSL